MNYPNLKSFYAIGLLIPILIISSCSKDDDQAEDNIAGPVPEVNTNLPTGVSQYGSFAGGEVINDNGATVTARGVCWSTSIDPSINDSISTDGTGAGEFKSLIRRLLPDTTYYVRAYATNARGTGYGSTYSIQTLAEISVQDLDGNTYHGITIEGKTWLTENLRTTTMTFPAGSPIPHVMDNSTWLAATTPAYCYYNDDPENRDKYGLLYNKFTTTSGLYTVCPAGWQIESASNWDDLKTALGGPEYAGGLLKVVGFEHWDQPNAGALDAFGFSADGGGYRDGLSGEYYNLGSFGFWWLGSGTSAAFLASNNAAAQTWNSVLSRDGFCIRCVMN